jgi:general stress protein YciG
MARGFASLTKEQRSAIARLGGKAAHVKGTAHEWTREEAQHAGRKGGTISRGGRGRDPKVAPAAATKG